MADSGEKIFYCGPCEYENINKLAAKWCSDCGEGYCDECLRVHKGAKITRHHHLVPVAECQEVAQLSIPQVCQVHQKAFEYFCPGHDSVICILCVKSEHSKCPDPLSLQKAAKGAKSSTALSDLEQSINNLLDNVKNGIKIEDSNLSSLLESEQSIKIAIKAKHGEIIQYFERLQEKTYMELKAKYGQCQQEISSSQNKFMKKHTQLQNMKDRILQMKKCLSDVQAFVGMKMMTQNINVEKEVVKSLVTDMSSLVLKFEPNLKIPTSTENIDTYGTTTTATSKSIATFVEPKVQQAQLKITPVKSVESIQLELRTRINLKCMPGEITSCLILPNKQIMILDHSKMYLMIYNENGSHDRKIAVSYYPFDATVIDTDTVAVTFGNKIITIVDIKSNKIERNIENGVEEWCWGISHDNGKLYVVCYGEGINVLDLSGCIIKKFTLDVKAVFKIVATSGYVIYTDRRGHLFSLDANGSKKLEYASSELVSDPQSSSSGITTDERCNVYVVGELSNVLIAVSKDGKTQKVLLTEKDLLKNPEAVYYSKRHKQLLICNRENGLAALYDVRF